MASTRNTSQQDNQQFAPQVNLPHHPGPGSPTIPLPQHDPPPDQQVTGTVPSPDPEDIAPTPFETPDRDIPTTPSHSRTGENITKIWVLATLPLIIHFASVLILVAVVITYVNGHDFNLQSRYALSKITPLQSNITT